MGGRNEMALGGQAEWGMYVSWSPEDDEAEDVTAQKPLRLGVQLTFRV